METEKSRVKKCPNCGATIMPGMTKCPDCGYEFIAEPIQPAQPAQPAQAQAIAEECPETHMTKAIISTCLFSVLLGIITIVNASKVKSAFASGNLALAKEYSKKADTWGSIAIWVGLAGKILAFLLLEEI